MQFSIETTVKTKNAKAPTINTSNAFLSIQELAFYLKEGLIRIALDALSEEQGKGTFPKKEFGTVVDGRKTKSLEKVKPFGKIQFVAPRALREIIEFIIRGLEDRSPIDTGQFRDNHYVIHNDNLLDADTPESILRYFAEVNIKKGDVVRFINITPYAGRLEREGITRSKRSRRIIKSRDKRQRSGPRVRAPNGVYHLTYKAAKKKFGALHDFSQGKSGFVTGGAIKGAPFPTTSYRGKKLRRDFANGKRGPYAYPTFWFKVR